LKLTETELGQVAMVEALLLVVDQFPEFLHVDLFLEAGARLLDAPEPVQDLFSGPVHRDGLP